MAPKKRKEVEDPTNTWNMQLMAAALRFDVEEAERLLEKGANLVTAREATPFAPQDKLSPLAAVLLQGDLGPSALVMLRFLIEHGASLDERMPLPIAGNVVVDGQSGGVLDGVKRPAATSSSPLALNSATTTNTASGKKSGAASPLNSGGAESAKRLSMAAAAASSVPGSPPHVTASDSNNNNNNSNSTTSAVHCDEGTVLHYLIAAGDHTHLLQLLLLAGVRRDGVRTKPPPQEDGGEDMSAKHDGGGVHWLPAQHGHEKNTATQTQSSSGAAGRGGRASGAAATVTTSIVAENHNHKKKNDGNADKTQNASADPRAALFTYDDAESPAGEQEAIAVLPYTLCRDIAQEYAAHKAAVLEAAVAGTGDVPTSTSAGGANSRSASRGGMGSGARDRSRSRATSLRAASSPTAPSRPRLPLLSSMPSPTDRERVLVSVPGESGVKGLREVVFDMTTRTSHSALTAVEFAIEKGDLLATQLLLFYGAHLAHDRLVNGTQTALARACSTGQVELVELLLNAGAPLGQISHDGRYTLIHYAVGQPAVLNYLVRRGLSMETENIFGDSALVSLIRYGTGRNSPHAIRETVNLDDVQKLAALPHAALRNYILMPFPPPMNQSTGGPGGGKKASNSATGGAGGRGGVGGRGVSFTASASTAAGGGGNSGRRAPSASSAAVPDPVELAAAAFATMGGGEMGTWWSFTPHSTAILIGNVLEAGANFHGYIPDEELDLAYVRFSEGEVARKVAEKESAEAVAAAAKRDDAASRHARLGKKRMSGGSLGSRGTTSRTGMTSPLTQGLSSPTRTDAFHLAGVGLEGDELAGSVDELASESAMRTSLLGAGGGGEGLTTAHQVPGRPPLRLTPLMHAIVNYHPEVIAKFVLEYKVDLTRRDSFGATALHYACAMVPQHATSVLNLLLDVLVKEGGAAALSGGTAGSFGPTSGNAGSGGVSGGGGGAAGSSMGSVAQSGRRRSASSSTRVDAVPFDLNAVDMAGMTALHYAAACGNDAAVERLLATTSASAARASAAGGAALHVGLPDARGRTALHWAVEANAPRVVELLVRHTATVAETALGHGTDGFLASLGLGTSSSLVGGGGGGSTGSRSPSRGRVASPSSLSSQQRRASSPSSSIGLGTGTFGAPASPYVTVDVEAEEQETNATALELAIKGRPHCHPSIVRTLLREGNAAFYRASGLPSGGTLLHRAVMDSNVGCVEALLEQYADPNEVDDNDETPLFLALRQLSRCRVQCDGDGKSEEHTDLADDEEEEEENQDEDDMACVGAADGSGEMGEGSSQADRAQRGADKRAQTRAARLAIVDALLRAGAHVYAQSMTSLSTPLHEAAAVGAQDVLERVFFEPAADMFGSVTSTVLTRRASRSGDTKAPLPSGEANDVDCGGTSTTSTTTAAYSGSGGGRLGLAERVRQSRRAKQEAGSDHAAAPCVTVEAGSPASSTASPSGGRGASRTHQPHATAAATLLPLSRWLLTNALDQTPLHVLCARVDRSAQLAAVPVLEKLLRMPSDAKNTATTTTTAAAAAAACVDDETEMLRERLLGHLDHQGRTALHAACRAHFVEAVVLLLATRPASVFAVDARGWTPLHDAVAFPLAQSHTDASEDGEVEKEDHDESLRLTAVLNALAATVSALTTTRTGSARLEWSGLPLPAMISTTSSKNSSTTALSLTQQLRAHHHREQQWMLLRTDAYDLNTGVFHGMSTSTAVADPGDARRRYAGYVDEHGRTALLLAGDVGNTTAAKAVLSLFC